jgi:hypothetical protein
MADEEDKGNSQPSFWFEGFFEPSFTMIPDTLFDELAPNLTESELRVALYIMRRTFGFKKQSDAISINQLISGISTRDGRVLDRGTGMSRQGVMRGIKGLTAKGVIVVRKEVGEDGVNQVNLYALRFREQGVVYERDYGGLPSRPRVVNEVDPQHTVKQQTEKQHTVKEFETSKDQRRNIDITLEAMAVIGRYIEDLARELRDEAPLSSSTTRACRIYAASNLELDAFTGAMLEARRRTQEHSAGIKKPAANGRPGEKSKMSYWFRVLEDVVGVSGLDATG